MADAPTSADAADAVARRAALIDNLIAKGTLRDARVAEAFRTVPRHPFLPEKTLATVYRDAAIPTKFDAKGLAISSSSQPSIMAIMLEQLELKPGANVLEIGAGTGYNAALMAHLVGAEGHVTTIDLDRDIAAAAQMHLATLGVSNVTVVCGDGVAGYVANAPYDRIILTVGGWDVALTWLRQLQPDGRLLLPLSLNGPQYAIAFERDDDGALTSVSVRSCGFMRLRGPHAGPDESISVGPDQDVFLGYEKDANHPRLLQPEPIWSWLTGDYREQATPHLFSARNAWGSLSLWLSLREPDMITLSVRGEMARTETVPYLLGNHSETPWHLTRGIATALGMVLLARRRVKEELSQSPTSTLSLRCYGQADPLAERLRSHLTAWEAAGRPNPEQIQVRALPLTRPGAETGAVHRRWHRFVVAWPVPDGARRA